jgi:hypothetical protein
MLDTQVRNTRFGPLYFAGDFTPVSLLASGETTENGVISAIFATSAT